MRAFILIKVKPGYEDRLAELILEDEKRVVRVLKVFGPYDLICEVSATTLEELEKAVARVRRFPDVIDTVTLVIAKEKSRS